MKKRDCELYLSTAGDCLIAALLSLLLGACSLVLWIKCWKASLLTGADSCARRTCCKGKVVKAWEHSEDPPHRCHQNIGGKRKEKNLFSISLERMNYCSLKKGVPLAKKKNSRIISKIRLVEIKYKVFYPRSDCNSLLSKEHKFWIQDFVRSLFFSKKKNRLTFIGAEGFLVSYKDIFPLAVPMANVLPSKLQSHDVRGVSVSIRAAVWWSFKLKICARLSLPTEHKRWWSDLWKLKSCTAAECLLIYQIINNGKKEGWERKYIYREKCSSNFSCLKKEKRKNNSNHGGDVGIVIKSWWDENSKICTDYR